MVFDSVSVNELNLEDPVYRKKRRLKTKAQVSATLSNYAEEELPEWISHNQDTTRRNLEGFSKMRADQSAMSNPSMELS